VAGAEDLVVLTQVPDELSALLIVGELESQGVPAVVIGGLTAQLRAEAPGLVSVMVRRMDLPRAQAFLEQTAPPPGWEDEAEAEAAPREDEEGFFADEPGDDADGREARRRGDL
jgi:hypothetical protein